MFWVFGHEACEILAPQPEIEPVPFSWEGKVLITGPPGKTLPQEFRLFTGAHFSCPASPSEGLVLSAEDKDGRL